MLNWQLGLVVHTSTWEAYDFKARLGYVVSSRSDWATYQDLVSKQKNKNKNTKRKKKDVQLINKCVPK
jgi:hypothetical protein